jgi:capsule polysaccharide export protein KpsE/RkpR
MNQSTPQAMDKTVMFDADTANRAAPADADKIGLIDLMLMLARHRYLVFVLPLLCAVSAVGMVVSMRDVYTASAQVMPVQSSQTNSAAAVLGQLNMGNFGSALSNKNAELFTRIMQSRKIGERVVKRFELVRRYEVDSVGQALAILSAKIDFEIDNQSGVVRVNVDDWNPATSADMANFIVDQLIVVTREIALSEATQRRIYFQNQLAGAQQRQRTAEVELKAYQARTGVYGLEQKAGNTLGMIARLEAEIAAKEIQLGVMRTTMTDGNPQMLGLLATLKGLHGQLARLKSESGNVENSLGQLSDISTEYSRLFREVKYQESVNEILNKQFEMAKLDEARDVPSVQVLDYAVQPELHSKPRRKLIVLAALFGGGLLGIMAAFVAESFQQARREPDSARKLKQIRQHLFSTRLGGAVREE